MKKYSIVSVSGISAAVAALVLGASSAFAAAPAVSVVGVNASVVGSGTAGTNTSADINTNVNAAVDTGVMASSSTDTSANTNTNTDYSGGNTGGILNASINIDSDDPTLTAQAQAIAQSDPAVSAISTDGNDVSISYKVPVRLFGFIPVHETETATVDTSAQAQGSSPQASVSRPWWSFLAAGNSSGDASTFSANLNNRLSEAGTTSTSADVMTDIEGAAQESSVAGSASATANASASSEY